MNAGPYSIGSAHWPGVSKLIEEIGELGQVLGKLIATNGETAHWDGTDLGVRLVEELGDVTGAIAFLLLANGIKNKPVLDRADEKLALFEKWHAAQGGACMSAAVLAEIAARLMPTNDGQTDTGDVPALLGIPNAVADYADRLADRAAMVADQPVAACIYGEVAATLRDVLTAYLTSFAELGFVFVEHVATTEYVRGWWKAACPCGWRSAVQFREAATALAIAEAHVQDPDSLAVGAA